MQTELLIRSAILMKSITKSVQQFRTCSKIAVPHGNAHTRNKLGSIWLIAFKSVRFSWVWFSTAYFGLAHFKSVWIVAHYLVSTIIIQSSQDKPSRAKLKSQIIPFLLLLLWLFNRSWSHCLSLLFPLFRSVHMRIAFIFSIVNSFLHVCL